MGHIIRKMVVEKGTPREDVLHEIRQEVEHEAYFEGGRYHENLTWHEGKVYANRDEAEDAIRDFDDGFYSDHAVLFKYAERKPNAKIRKLSERKKALEETMRDYSAAHSIHNRKSAFIGCPKCGSKLSREHLRKASERCPLCSADLRPASTLDRINGYHRRMAEVQDAIDAEWRAIDSAKGKVMWLVKYEYHV